MMNKLEQKLIEMGYKKIIHSNFIRYFKGYDADTEIIIDLEYERICNYMVWCTSAIKIQEHINSLQQAFNEMQKDLEVLKQCQD